MNWANRLTIARFFLTLGFVAALSSHWPYSHTVGLVLFVLAAITDYVDGEIARRYSVETDFGKLMDPLVDKIMMAAGFICLVPLPAGVPAWVVIVIISREFLVTGLRLLATSKGRVLAAETMGKHKTAWQITTIVFFLVLLSIRELHQLRAGDPGAWWSHVWLYGGSALLMVAVATTLVSGIVYLWKNRDLIVVGRESDRANRAL